MGVDDIHLEFENPSLQFFPGQSVNGKVVITCDSSTETEGVVMTFLGKESVYWTEIDYRDYKKRRGTQYRKRVFQDQQTYFNNGFFLVGNENSRVTLPPGRTEYMFQYILPRPLPSTFHGEHGSVAYRVHAEVLRSWYKSNNKAENEFQVTAFVDLNMVPTATQPFSVGASKTLCCLCCTSGPIGVTFSIPRQGWLAGDFLPFEAVLQNLSRREVTEVKITLVQFVVYHAGGSRNFVNNSLLYITRPGLEPGTSDVWRDSFQIPYYPPTDLGGCPHIKVQYNMELEMDIAGPTKNLKVWVPVFIGTIPLRTNEAQQQPPPPGQELPAPP